MPRLLQGGPERLRQSNLAVFTIDFKFDTKYSYAKSNLSFYNINIILPFRY